MFRYWDGQSWSEQISSDPSAPPPGPGAPPSAPPTEVAPPGQFGGQDPYQQQYGQQFGQQQYGQEQYAQQQPGQPQPGQYGGGGYGPQDPYGQGYPGGGGGGGGKRIALIALAVLLIAGLAVGGFFGARALTDDDGDETAGDDTSQNEETEATEETESPTDETETPSDETPTESPSDTGPTGRECTGGLPSIGGEVTGRGRVRGGDLELPPVRGFQGVEQASAFTFADEVGTIGKQIEEGWIALYAVGSLTKSNGYTDLAASADQVITCMTESPNFYRNFTERNDLDRESIEVDGHEAYSVTTEIRVDDPEITVEGDVARVIVVDTGDEEAFGLYVSVVPIGDQRLIDQQDNASGTLKVDD